MSEASSLAGRKRDRRSRSVVGGSGPKLDVTVESLARVRRACQQVGGRPYRMALDELAEAVQQIFSARLVVLRDPADSLGLAPAGIDPRDWLDTLDSLRHDDDSSPR